MTIPQKIQLIHRILQQVSQHLQVPVWEVLGRSRRIKLVDARQITMLLIREQGLDFTAIGRFMNRHHASVMYSVKNIQGRIDIYAEFKKYYHELKQITDDKNQKSSAIEQGSGAHNR
jgi:chromosomal replication initiator protein